MYLIKYVEKNLKNQNKLIFNSLYFYMEDKIKIRFFYVIFCIIYLVSSYKWITKIDNISYIKDKLIMINKNKENFILNITFIILFCLYIFYFDIYGINDNKLKKKN